MTISSILGLFGFASPSGPQMPTGQDLSNLANLIFSVKASIVAHAGGGQSAATPLPAVWNEIDTVASGNDSVLLPPAIPGTFVFVNNATATNSVQVFGVAQNVNNPTTASPAGAGDTIAAHNSSTQTATATGVAQAAAAVGLYACFTLGQWKQMLFT